MKILKPIYLSTVHSKVELDSKVELELEDSSTPNELQQRNFEKSGHDSINRRGGARQRSLQYLYVIHQ
jgi:hypothetical protein